jgi:hypothetical protein
VEKEIAAGYTYPLYRAGLDMGFGGLVS